jgi:hypothetical protein
MLTTVKKIEKLIRRVGADEDLAQLEAALAPSSPGAA